MTTSSPYARLKSDMPGIVWPPVSAGPASVLAAMLGQLDETQWLAPEIIAANQFRQLRNVVHHAAAQSKHFRARLKAVNLAPDDLTTMEGLRRLPVLTRRDVQAAGADLFCAELPPGHAPVSEHKTSGSTGEPVVVRRTAMNQLDWLAMTMREHLWQGRDFSGRLAVIRGNIVKYNELDDWGPPASFLFPTGRSVGIPIRLDVAKQFEMLRAFGVETLSIYPNLLGALIAHARERKLTLPTLKFIRSISETLTPQVRIAAAEVFGARVSDCYSSEEAGYIALECPESGLYHTAESVIVEILGDGGAQREAGEVGRVVITDLHNFATPLIRYDIGDYAQAGAPCPCGRGLGTLARILGRERNLIVMPDGTRRWPLTGTREMLEIAPVKQLQYIQHDRERIEVRLVVGARLTPQQEARIARVIDQSLGHSFNLEFVYFDGALPLGTNGKFEEFVCKIGR